MSQITIRSKIVTALAAWAAAKTPAIPIVREGLAFTPPANNGTYVEVYVLPANTLVAAVDGTRKRYMGDVVCNIYCKDNMGTAESEGLAEEIANLFPVFPKNFLPVSVESVPSIKRATPQSNGYRVTPVTFSYRAEF